MKETMRWISLMSNHDMTKIRQDNQYKVDSSTQKLSDIDNHIDYCHNKLEFVGEIRILRNKID